MKKKLVNGCETPLVSGSAFFFRRAAASNTTDVNNRFLALPLTAKYMKRWRLFSRNLN